ncbi:hypothetical protein L596_014735 [Steinernema carpocapsae]|uniref:LEM domain-containing protein n=1 Tax=Steinernema carpocapsae TaxID=34508 RepID=A0A4U5NDM6_STECR|nr:hypothetical protein L596_014735 [Steinernema carpocapsae]
MTIEELRQEYEKWGAKPGPIAERNRKIFENQIMRFRRDSLGGSKRASTSRKSELIKDEPLNSSNDGPRSNGESPTVQDLLIPAPRPKPRRGRSSIRALLTSTTSSSSPSASTGASPAQSTSVSTTPAQVTSAADLRRSTITRQENPAAQTCTQESSDSAFVRRGIRARSSLARIVGTSASVKADKTPSGAPRTTGVQRSLAGQHALPFPSASPDLNGAYPKLSSPDLANAVRIISPAHMASSVLAPVMQSTASPAPVQRGPGRPPKSSRPGPPQSAVRTASISTATDAEIQEIPLASTQNRKRNYDDATEVQDGPAEPKRVRILSSPEENDEIAAYAKFIEKVMRKMDSTTRNNAQDDIYEILKKHR